ncbi:hypothetical protein PoB_004207800 [Plakobranchus ocellatus]|uniref:Uncharacterized protein n=1 Tax=Plakobranchus ocellatus TaxID=259542 RepID=A0AAV4B8T8_9GAST|nr:hypothetical protein PoB_004207800 [Plakobranchus ocellatus]
MPGRKTQTNCPHIEQVNQRRIEREKLSTENEKAHLQLGVISGRRRAEHHYRLKLVTEESLQIPGGSLAASPPTSPYEKDTKNLEYVHSEGTVLLAMDV